jgi:hypothetical protein
MGPWYGSMVWVAARNGTVLLARISSGMAQHSKSQHVFFMAQHSTARHATIYIYIYIYIVYRYIPRLLFLTVPVLRWARFVTVPVWSRLRFVTVPVRNRFRITGDSSSQYLNLCGKSAQFGSLAVQVGGSGSIPELTDIIVLCRYCLVLDVSNQSSAPQTKLCIDWFPSL